MCAKAIKSLRKASVGCGTFVALAMLLAASSAWGDEPRRATERPVLNEPGEITAVADAFDDFDPFDLHITVGFQQSWRSTKVMRESYSTVGTLSNGGYTADTMNVAKYSGSTSRLNTRLDIGVYKDFALYLRMPIILRDAYKLEGIDGSENSFAAIAGAPGERLFSVPFESPKRSGIEYLAVGFDVDIMSQNRNPTLPTWLFGIEGRFSISEPMRACNPSPNQGQVECAHPADVDRNGKVSDPWVSSTGQSMQLEGSNVSPRSPGVSRGTTAIELHTYISRRIKYIEPYGGFRAMAEFANSKSDFPNTGIEAATVTHPPIEGWVVAGLMVIPWENREMFRRFTIDGRVEAAYRSEGQDYSELFDALGSSDARTLRTPNYAKFTANNESNKAANPSVADTNSEKVYFTGITDVQAHAKFRVSSSLTFQASEYVKFQLGFAYMWVQPHFITMDQPCNSNTNSSPDIAGPCRITTKTATASGTSYNHTSTGRPNPNYRPVINQVGRRYKVDDTSVVDLWFNGIVMF
ncbi:MAG: hypothetical protein FWD57_10695 [Polyangiaceae bacterium]|nr:hypothetical protein [Polyangiaceae bacterium]